LRGRASSATPTGIPGLVAQQSVAAEGSSSLRGSPQTSITTAGEDQGREENINELISQYSSDTNPSANQNENIKQDNNSTDTKAQSYNRPSTIPNPSEKSQAPSLGSPTKVSKPASNGKLVVNGSANKFLGSRHASKGSLSEASEGEIVEEPTSQKALPPTELRQTQTPAKSINDGQIPRKLREEPLFKAFYGHGPRDASPPSRAINSNPKFSSNRDDLREEADSWIKQRTYQSDHSERRTYSSPDKQPHPRREARDQDEEHRRPETKPEQKREDNRLARETKPPNPTLVQLLPHDEDLREWLEITGYHNETYRDKILKRRRAIAALDAQKNALLAEMEAEERGGPPIAAALLIPSAMLPPPNPGKAATRANTIPEPETAKLEAQRDYTVSNKRPYSDLHDGCEDGGSGKILRTDDRYSRIKEDDDDHRRPRSSGYDSVRPFSGDRRVERDFPRSYDTDSGGRGRGGSRERDLSPGLNAYESRPVARTRGYDSGPDDYYDHDGREDRNSRPFQIRGGYRGRAFDPNYRGRGRGTRGRGGDYQSHFEPRSDSAPSTSFGSKIANGRPFKDHKGFNSGGKGG
jgi:hypothetical protein